MKKSVDTAVFRAFLKALNESRREYLVCGDMAASYHAGTRKIRTLEVWLAPPGKGVASELPVWAKLYRTLAPDAPGQQDIIDRIKVRRGSPTLAFGVAYAGRAEARFFDQPVTLVSPDHLVALQLAAASTRHEVNQAARLQREVRGRENQPPVSPVPRNPDEPVPKLRIVPKL